MTIQVRDHGNNVNGVQTTYSTEYISALERNGLLEIKTVYKLFSV